MRTSFGSMPGARLALAASVATACAAVSAPSRTSGAWTELRLSWDFGPCPADGRSCHQTLAVSPDGAFIASETQNGADPRAEPLRRYAALDPQELRELRRIVVPAFVDRVGSLGCPREYDATVRVALDGPWGVREDDIGGCAHSSDPSPNASRALVQLLERHRWAARDAPAKRPLVPSGVGDPCTVDVGCANGLTCVPAPCVIAPCVSGACQRAGT